MYPVTTLLNTSTINSCTCTRVHRKPSPGPRGNLPIKPTADHILQGNNNGTKAHDHRLQHCTLKWSNFLYTQKRGKLSHPKIKKRRNYPRGKKNGTHLFLSRGQKHDTLLCSFCSLDNLFLQTQASRDTLMKLAASSVINLARPIRWPSLPPFPAVATAHRYYPTLVVGPRDTCNSIKNISRHAQTTDASSCLW